MNVNGKILLFFYFLHDTSNNHAHVPAGLQVCVEVLLPDLPEVGPVPGAYQDAPGAADLPLPPLQQGVPLAV